VGWTDLDPKTWRVALKTAKKAGSRSALAELWSLGGRIEGSYPRARAAVRRARKAEPLNPLHSLRAGLVQLRFGRWADAQDELKELGEVLPDEPLPIYLRALACVGAGQWQRAANLAKTAAKKGLVEASFLEAEARLRFQPKRVNKLLMALPRDAHLAPAWADLLVKIVVVRPKDGVKMALQAADTHRALAPSSAPQEYRALVTRCRALLDRAIAWRAASAEELQEELGGTAVGSRAEELVLLFLDDALRTLEVEERLRRLRALYEASPERAGLRRLYVAAMTQCAALEVRKEDYSRGLRLIERCLFLEPQEPIHHQNRATLFTLLREPDAYHEAWGRLDRHRYRLALLGRREGLELPHRMFASQARTFPDAPQRGVFRPGDDERPPRVNGDQVGLDPDLLRQWLLHRQAELVLRHARLGLDPQRYLLLPVDPHQGRARLAALCTFTRALEVLGGGEGAALAEALTQRWSAQSHRLRTLYAEREADDEVAATQREHLTTLADLVLLCLDWSPDAAQRGAAEEALAFLEAGAVFFDERDLYAALDDPEHPTELRILAAQIEHALGSEESRPTLTPAQRVAVFGHARAIFLVQLAYLAYDQAGELNRKKAAESALAYVDRARKANDSEAFVELEATRFLLLGEFYDEARATSARFHQLVGPEDRQLQTQMEELQQHLSDIRDKGLEGSARAEPALTPQPRSARSGEWERDLEDELQHNPSAIASYEELVRRLAAEGRYDDARAWCERAIGRCLTRQAQLRARTLDLELAGIKELSTYDAEAARLYAAGLSRQATLSLLEGVPLDELSHPLAFLFGRGLLAAGRLEEARQAFARALRVCDRQLHRAVLRRLAADADEAFMEEIRGKVADRVQAAKWQPAVKLLAQAMRRVRRPEVCLIDLAEVLSAVAVGTWEDPPQLSFPRKLPDAAWASELAALGSATPLEQARGVARLASREHEASQGRADRILAKLEVFEERLRSAAALKTSSERLSAGDLEGALQALGEEIEPRIQRQRCLILLRLERFAEAGQVVEGLAESTSPVARELIQRYPSLVLDQRLARAGRLLAEGDELGTRALITGVEALTREQELELVYVRVFLQALMAYRLKREGQTREAVKALETALDFAEETLGPELGDPGKAIVLARKSGHSRLLELYARLEDEVEALE
jgi:hypothetical protein